MENRNELMKELALAHGRLRSAIRTIEIGENIEGCERPVQVSREVALSTIDCFMKNLSKLKESIKII